MSSAATFAFCLTSLYYFSHLLPRRARPTKENLSVELVFTGLLPEAMATVSKLAIENTAVFFMY